MSEIIHTLFRCLCNHSIPLALFLSQFGDMMESSYRMKRSFYAAKDLYKYRHSYPVKSYIYSLQISHAELGGRSFLNMKFPVNIAIRSAENIVEVRSKFFLHSQTVCILLSWFYSGILLLRTTRSLVSRMNIAIWGSIWIRSPWCRMVSVCFLFRFNEKIIRLYSGIWTRKQAIS